MRRKTLYFFAYLYLFIPICIFLATWIKSVISIPLIIISTYYIFRSIQNMPESSLNIKANKKKILIIAGILCMWVLLSGIGGFTWQNRWDHMFRNALFYDLVNNDWPVVNYKSGNPLILCYYIGYWLPSAIISKLFNSIFIGFLFELIYGFIGIIIAFLLMSEWLQKISYLTLIVFIFYSGMDIIPYILYNHDIDAFFRGIITFQHVELYLNWFNSSSNTTLLFWLYNQIIPFWIGFMLLLLQKNDKNIFFTYSLMLLFAPFPFVALIPAIIYLEIKKNGIVWINMKDYIIKFIQNYLTIPNCLGLLIIFILAMYYKSNLAVNIIQLIPLSLFNILLFFFFLFIEFGLLIILINKDIKKNYFFYVIIVTMIVFSFIQLGKSGDFAWRTCIPAAFYTMLLVIKYLINNSKKNIRYKILIFVLFLGSFTPTMEIMRTLKYTLTRKEPFISGGLDSVFYIDNYTDVNFVGKKDSFFGKYIMKNNGNENQHIEN